jgi:hypothetical protein
MKKFEIDGLKNDLESIFDTDSLDDALSWFIANSDRTAVIVVGAGFSKNALWKANGESAGKVIPLWKTITETLASALDLQRSENQSTKKTPLPFDDLLLADIYRTRFRNGKYVDTLLKSLPLPKR